MVRKHSKAELEASIQVRRQDEVRVGKEERTEGGMAETSSNMNREILKPKGYGGYPFASHNFTDEQNRFRRG